MQKSLIPLSLLFILISCESNEVASQIDSPCENCSFEPVDTTFSVFIYPGLPQLTELTQFNTATYTLGKSYKLCDVNFELDSVENTSIIRCQGLIYENCNESNLIEIGSYEWVSTCANKPDTLDQSFDLTSTQWRFYSTSDYGVIPCELEPSFLFFNQVEGELFIGALGWGASGVQISNDSLKFVSDGITLDGLPTLNGNIFRGSFRDIVFEGVDTVLLTYSLHHNFLRLRRPDNAKEIIFYTE